MESALGRTCREKWNEYKSVQIDIRNRGMELNRISVDTSVLLLSSSSRWRPCIKSLAFIFILYLFTLAPLFSSHPHSILFQEQQPLPASIHWPTQKKPTFRIIFIDLFLNLIDGPSSAGKWYHEDKTEECYGVLPRSSATEDASGTGRSWSSY